MLENTNIKQFYPGPILNKTLDITNFLFKDLEQVHITYTYKKEDGSFDNRELTYGTEYEVTKILPSDVAQADAALTASTGKVTLKVDLNVAAGERLTIYRKSEIIQEAQYPRTGPFPAASHEGALDYLTMQNQEQQDQINRSLKVPISTVNFNGALPVPVPTRALKINNSGSGFELSEYDPDTALETTKEYLEGAQTAASDALASQNAAASSANSAANSVTIATQQANLATQQANLATQKVQEIINIAGASWRPSLLQPFWSEYELDRMDMLRADTFSWQNGTAYSAVYSLLFGEYNNSASTEQTENGITFKVTPRGFRIADATQEQAILNLYNTTGVAGYFIIDPTNTRFKLPRTKYGFVGLRDSVGGYVAESLPNITGEAVGPSGISATGAFKVYNLISPLSGGSSSMVREGTLGFDASLSSSTYRDDAPVQQRATQMYLYFYVGEYAQTAIEQTAGLNAELFNGKVDLNFNNMNPSQTAKNTIVEWGMPDYSAGVDYANDTTVHTAPSNGILAISYRVKSGSGYLKINEANVAMSWVITAYATMVTGEYLLSQGDAFQITAEALNNKDIPLIYRFYPCKGVN